MTKLIRAFLAMIMLTLLSACGGGGGSAGNTSGVALFTNAAEKITILPGAAQTYTIGGGIPNYSATSSTSAATVNANGKTLTITGSGAGKSTVTVTDSAGAKVLIEVTVGTGFDFFVNAPDKITLSTGAVSATFDFGGGSGVYTVTSSDPGIAKVTTNGKQFFVVGVSAGNATISAADNAGGKKSIEVTVGSGVGLFINAPASLTVAIGASTQSFTIGGGTQVYTASSSDSQVATVKQTGNTFVVSGVSAGTSTVTITDSAGANKSVNVTVGSTQPLYTTAPESLTVGVGASSQSFKIGGGAQAYTVISSNQQIATVKQTGSDFVITGVAPGVTTIVITDVVGASKRIALTVGSNQALFTTAPESLDVGIGSTSSTFEIGGGEPTYVVNSSNSSIASVSSSTNKFTITGVSSGKTVITISDQFGQKISLTVNVSSGSDLFTTAPESLTVGVGANTQSFTIGGGTQVYTVSSSNLAIVNVIKSGNTFVISGVSPGTSTVTITDSSGAKKVVSVTVGSSQPLFTTAPESLTIAVGVPTQSFRAGGGAQAYTVISSNQQIATVSQTGSEFVITGVAPGSTTIVITDVVGAVKRITLTVGSNQALFVTAPATLDVGIGSTSPTFDIGGGEPSYVVTTSNSLVASVSNSLNKFSVTGVSSGKAIITITDKFGQKVSLNVNVSSGSDLYITAPATVSVGLGLTSSTYTIGGGSKIYTVSSGDNSIVSVVQNGNQFVLKGERLGTVKVTVSDSLGVVRNIDVSVVNGLQLYTTAPSALTVGVGVNSATYLIGGGAAPYSVASSNSAVVTVSHIGAQFFLTGGISGKATVLITDGVGGSKSIDVTVSTGSDLFTNAGSDINVGVGVTTSPFVIGGGSLVYSVSSANAQVATISIQSNTFTVTGVAVGKTSLFVTDSLGATKKIDVTVGSPLDLFVTSPLDLTIGVGITSPQYNIGGGTSPYAVASSNTQVFSVTLTGSSFKITGISAGKGNLIVTDAKGATKSISVTVGSGIDLYTTAPTSVIVAVNASSQVYKIGGGSEVYSVSSSDDKIVVVGQNTSKEFVITGKSGGKAVVSVKDSTGKEVKIDVIVGTVDAMFSTAAADINLEVGGANTFKVGGGTGVYTVGSSSTTVAQATISGNDIVILGVGTGKATIVIRDTTTGSVTINVTVGTANPIPLFTTAASDIIVAPGASPTFVIGGGRAPYAVTSSNPSVATASVNGTTLTLVGVAAGNSKINLTDSLGAPVVINVTVNNGNVLDLFTTAPTQITIGKGVSATYIISGGTAPYTVTSSNTAMLTTSLSGNSFSVLGISPGDLQISIQDAVGKVITRSITVTPVISKVLDVLPGNATGAVGDVLTFRLVGGTPNFTVTNNNPSIATVSPTSLGADGVFTATLLNVGATDVTILDSQGISKKITITATAANSLLRISPSVILVAEESTGAVDLAIYGGRPPYRVFTSDLALSSVSIVGTSTLRVGLGSTGNRCFIPIDSSGTYKPLGIGTITLTVLDTLGASATAQFNLQDNGMGNALGVPPGTGGCTPQ
ncbi:beta strand repeat-containing protein [Undibacterium sp. Ji22W]|uniref:beta strand repeat-containing protein n=1 Tax=Undibacterium sp. Ji22W TaxID=3413038 RepID=UPI003BEFD9D5